MLASSEGSVLQDRRTLSNRLGLCYFGFFEDAVNMKQIKLKLTTVNWKKQYIYWSSSHKCSDLMKLFRLGRNTGHSSYNGNCKKRKTNKEECPISNKHPCTPKSSKFWAKQKHDFKQKYTEGYHVYHICVFLRELFLQFRHLFIKLETYNVIAISLNCMSSIV